MLSGGQSDSGVMDKCDSGTKRNTRPQEAGGSCPVGGEYTMLPTRPQTGCNNVTSRQDTKGGLLFREPIGVCAPDVVFHEPARLNTFIRTKYPHLRPHPLCITIALCIMVKATRLKPLPRTSQSTERPLGPLGSLELPTAVCFIGFNHIGGLVGGGETPCATVTNPPMRTAVPVTPYTCESTLWNFRNSPSPPCCA